MNTNALRGLAVSALLAISLTSCSGGGASSAESEPAPVSESATPTEVPFKTYSRVELGKILESVRDSNDTRLLVMPDDRLKDALKQAKDIVSNSTVEPAACAEFVAGGGAQLEDGAVVSIGASASSNAESIVLLTLVSGVSEDRVNELMAGRAANVKSCGASQATILGQSVEAVTSVLQTSAKTDGALAYKSSATAPGAGSQDQVVVMAAKGGVVLMGQSTGATVADSDLPKLEAMLDQAADLIK
ncbi:hypothetical protein IG195_02830 [Arthrobacter sp. TES]|jgi:hypothetical protein|uniref:hypothetical protein n=1 Tax=Paenarthrobacter ureafaciens TaxID=37931 RepID=UPI000A80AE98|nr:hypothetical protein [Paenarthrobacter ureafaciens]QOI64061.1 hypothetical protein IG195_02830 [Arthrobacter sp. TES]QQQ63230.1 hypothetical protein JHQ56_05260 [Paenarthrobacter ureafaciens]